MLPDLAGACGCGGMSWTRHRAQRGAMLVSAKAGEVFAPLLDDIKVEQVPGAPIYYVIGHYGVPNERNEGHTSNAGFVVTDEGVVVFDTLGTPALGDALLRHIRKNNSKPKILTQYTL